MVVSSSSTVSAFAISISEVGAGFERERDAAERAGENGLTADKTQISFGSLEQGMPAVGQDIALANNGATDLELLWYEFDYYDFISIDAPDDCMINIVLKLTM